MAFMDTYTGFIFWSNIWLSPIALLYPVLQKACVWCLPRNCEVNKSPTNHLSLSLPCAPEIFWSVICYGTWHPSWGGPCTGSGIAHATACQQSYWGLYTGQCIHSFFKTHVGTTWVFSRRQAGGVVACNGFCSWLDGHHIGGGSTVRTVELCGRIRPLSCAGGFSWVVGHTNWWRHCLQHFWRKIYIHKNRLTSEQFLE